MCILDITLSSRTIEIGALFAQTGALARPERAQLQGFMLAVSAINAGGGVLGRELVPVVIDTASDPGHATATATTMIRQGIEHLFGCSDSRVRKALIPRLERQNALLWYGTQFEGFEYSSNIVYGGACPNQHVAPLFDNLFERGHGDYLLVGSDFLFSRECNRVARQIVETQGGKILGELYLPTDAGEDAVDSMVSMLNRRPDAVFSSVVGSSAMQLSAVLQKRGATAPLASVAISEIDLALQPELFEGQISAVPYFETLSNPFNERFLTAFRKRFGPNARAGWLTANAYVQVMDFAQTAERAGSIAVDDMLAHLGAAMVDSPFGPCRIDPDNHYTHCLPRIGLANAQGRFDLQHEAAQVVPPDPYFIAYA